MSDVELLELLELFFAHTVGPLVVALAVPLLTVVVLLVLSPPLALVMLPFVLLAATVPAWLHRR